MTRILFGLAMIAMLAISPVLSSSFAASDTLPGGTSIEVTIGTPSDDAVFPLPLGDTSVDVTVDGTASVGEGLPLKDTDIIYIVDVSGSMNQRSNVDCNEDGIVDPTTGGPDSRLNCAIAGITTANDAASDPFSAISKTGLGTFNQTGAARNVDFGASGPQLLVSPDYDGNANSIADLIDAISAVTVEGFTSYGSGLDALEEILAQSTSQKKIVVFLSDGQNNRGPAVSDFVFGDDVVINAFAVGGGGGVSCNTTPASDPFLPGVYLGNLNDVVALTPGGSCTNVTDMSELADLISDSIGSTLETLEISVDGSTPILVDNADIDTPLPEMGPVMVTYSVDALGLESGSHEICVTATGITAFGSGSVTECVDISVNSPPDCDDVTADIDFLWPPNHKMVTVTIAGATDPDGDAVVLSVVSVTQDEPTEGLGDGDESPDAEISGSSVDLRSERSGIGDGRVYEISFAADDGNSGMCEGTVTVTVPHDKKGTAVDSGEDYLSTS